MARLEFNSVELLRIAWKASASADEDFMSRGPSALTLDSLAAIVFSAAAVEAFTNDLADHVEVWRQLENSEAPSWGAAEWGTAKWGFNATTPELIRAVADMLAIETERQPDQLSGKVRAATRALANDPRKSDGRDIQDLGRLIVLRDAILHARAPRPAPRTELVDVLRDLARQGLTVPREGGDANAFFEMESPRLARWAYRSGYRIIHAMLDLVPANVGAIQSLRTVLRDSVKIPPPR